MYQRHIDEMCEAYDEFEHPKIYRVGYSFSICTKEYRKLENAIEDCKLPEEKVFDYMGVILFENGNLEYIIGETYEDAIAEYKNKYSIFCREKAIRCCPPGKNVYDITGNIVYSNRKEDNGTFAYNIKKSIELELHPIDVDDLPYVQIWKDITERVNNMCIKNKDNECFKSKILSEMAHLEYKYPFSCESRCNELKQFFKESVQFEQDLQDNLYKIFYKCNSESKERLDAYENFTSFIPEMEFKKSNHMNKENIKEFIKNLVVE